MQTPIHNLRPAIDRARWAHRRSPSHKGLLLVAIAVYLAAGCQPVDATSCGGPRTFVETFDQADYIVRARVDSAASGAIQELTVRELLKGERVSELEIDLASGGSCPSNTFAEGEEWVLFLRGPFPWAGSSHFRMARGSFRLTPVAEDAERWAQARLEAIRTARHGSLPALEAPWSATQSGSTTCSLTKPVYGGEAAGRIVFLAASAGIARLHIEYRLRDRSQADGSPDQSFTLEIGGVPHEIQPHGGWGNTPAHFVAHRTLAQYILDSLELAGSSAVKASLSGRFETAVGMDDFTPALHQFRRCSEALSVKKTGLVLAAEAD